MSVLTVQQHVSRKRLSTLAASLFGTIAVLLGRVVAPHKAALANLRAIPLTVLGAGCIDFAAFHLAHGWGWLVTGVSLVLIEHLISDET